MSACERWFYVRGGQLWAHIELDGWAFLKDPNWHHDELLCSVEDAETRYPAELAQARAGG